MAKVVFFSSSAYALPVLRSLLQNPEFQLSAVVTKPDKPFGRDQKILPNPIADFCRSRSLPLLQPEDFDQNFIDQFRSLSPDLGLVVAYGPPFFTAEMIEIPRHRIVNIHPSPLPRYRGATPGPWQIINGEAKSAITFFQIDPLPDHGPIITHIPFDISSGETADSFYLKAFALAAATLASTLNSYLSNPNFLQPQDHSQKSYFPKFTKDSAKINWSWPPIKIERFIRALNPWPIAWTYVLDSKNQKIKMKIFSAEIRDVTNFSAHSERKSATADEPEGSAHCKNLLQAITLKTIQVEGKKPTSWAEISKYYQVTSD